MSEPEQTTDAADRVFCPRCGNDSRPGDRCEACGNPLESYDESQMFLVLPSWGRLHIRVIGDPQQVIPALRAVWSDYERKTAVNTYPSQLGELVAGRDVITLLGPDVAAERLPELLEKHHGLRDAIDVRFEAMTDEAFEAAVGRLGW